MEKRIKMETIVSAYYQNPINQKQFAAKHGISVYQLKYWLKKIKKKGIENRKGSFIRLNTESEVNTAMPLEINYPNGISIKTHDTNPAFLVQLIKLY